VSQTSDTIKHSLDERSRELSRANIQLRELLEQLEATNLRLEHERLRDQALFNSLGEGLLVIDQDGIITTVNPRACEMLGFNDSELLGQWYPRVVQAVTPDGHAIPTLERLIIKSLLQGETITGTKYFARKDGSLFPSAVNVAPVLLEGHPVGAIEVFRDITEEQALDKAKEEFVSLASHQLRTPATAVKAILSMLTSGDFGELTPRQKHFINKAIATNDRQLSIIEDMLHAARIDAGKMQLSVTEVDIVTLCNDVVKEQLRDIEAQKLTISVADCPQELYVVADPVKLRMVLDNLVSNARKYTPKGGRINVRALSLEKKVKVEVADNGVGIHNSDIHKLFNKFSRVDNHLSAEVGGSGLGLYLVKHIINLHRGSIHVASEPGRGSTFTVELPRAGRAENTIGD
jgi:PAS domain S-box-containing protein